MPADSRAAQDKSLDPALLSDENLERVRALDKIAKGRGQTLAQLALAWLLRDERVTSVLVGASSVAQLETNVGAVDAPALTDDELEQIEPYAVDGSINLWAPSSDS